MKSKKVITLLLGIAIMLTTQTHVSLAFEDHIQEQVSYGLSEEVDGSQILQIWNWSFNETTANMQKIAEQGFTAIQTSPIQQAKTSTVNSAMNNWWMYYQPATFGIDDSDGSALGTKAEFEEMCSVAEEYGIKVIVDVVLNHTGNNTSNDIALAVDPILKDDPDCWHDITRNTTDYKDRFNITQYCMAGLPDLNTANPKVQDIALDFLKECVDAGADGFRYDGAKHIEVPDEEGGSDFWSVVIGGINEYAKAQGKELYHYGEVLDATGGDGELTVEKYTEYMDITVNTFGNSIRNAVYYEGMSPVNFVEYRYNDGTVVDPSASVIWNESHDTYANGDSTSLTDEILNKTWALIGSKDGSTGMYFARPNNMNIPIGTVSYTGWTSPEVAAVNHFNNYFMGEKEQIVENDTHVMVERGTTGAIIVSLLEGSFGQVTMPVANMEDGTYKDSLTGNEFTVKDGEITGTIGDTGIAVVYNPKTKPIIKEQQGIYFDNSEKNWEEVYCYIFDGTIDQSVPNIVEQATYTEIRLTDGVAWDGINAYFFDNMTHTDVGSSWPGEPMELDETSEEGVHTYVINVPDGATSVVFNTQSGSVQTVDVNLGTEGFTLDGSMLGDKFNVVPWGGEVEATSNSISNWPGVKMEYDSVTELYYMQVPFGYETSCVVFSENGNTSTNIYPQVGTDALLLTENTMTLTSDYQWIEEVVDDAQMNDLENQDADNGMGLPIIFGILGVACCVVIIAKVYFRKNKLNR